MLLEIVGLARLGVGVEEKIEAIALLGEVSSGHLHDRRLN